MSQDPVPAKDDAHDHDVADGRDPDVGDLAIGDRGAPAPRPRTYWRGGSRRQALYFIVLCMLLVGALLVAVDQWRKGLVVMGSSLLLGGAARALLPSRLVGWLAVRNRTSDVVFCMMFGVSLIVTAVVARGSI